jgi:hypothetical protein
LMRHTLGMTLDKTHTRTHAHTQDTHKIRHTGHTPQTHNIHTTHITQRHRHTDIHTWSSHLAQVKVLSFLELVRCCPWRTTRHNNQKLEQKIETRTGTETDRKDKDRDRRTETEGTVPSTRETRMETPAGSHRKKIILEL